jgi:nucleoid DNA-binding protein
MASRNTKGGFHRHCAIDIHDLLDIPLDKNGDPSLGTKILRAIIATMRDALHRGEDVKIPGFGIFRVVEWKPKRTGNNIISQDGTRSPVPLERMSKRVVTFIPAEQLKAMLNLGTTWDEKRAMETWNK